MGQMADKATRQVRVYEDVADMIGDIIDVESGTTADLLDPLIRPAVEQKHAELRPAIRAIKAARARHQRQHVELGEAGA